MSRGVADALLDGLVESGTVFDCNPAALDCEQLAHWSMHGVADYLVAHNVDALEDGLVQLTSSEVARSPVQLVRPFKNRQESVDVFDGWRQVVVRIGKLDLEFFALPGDLAQPCLDRAGFDLSVSGEVKQVLLLDRQPDELTLDLVAKRIERCGLILRGLLDELPHCVDELGAESHGSIVLLDGSLNTVDV